MSNATGVITAAAAVLALSLVSKKNAAGTLIFSPDTSLPKIRFSGYTPIITFGVVAQNTSNQSFTVEAIAGNLYAEEMGKDTYIGNVSAFFQQTIAKKSQVVLMLDAKLFPINIVNEIIDAITQANYQRIVKLDAVANVDGLQVPIKLNFKVG